MCVYVCVCVGGGVAGGRGAGGRGGGRVLTMLTMMKSLLPRSRGTSQLDTNASTSEACHWQTHAFMHELLRSSGKLPRPRIAKS